MSAHSPYRGRAIVLLLTTCVGMACHTWRTESLAPQAVLAAYQPTQLLVVLSDGSRIVLADPVLHADTLSGTNTQTSQREPIHILFADVRQVATRHFSASKTIGLGLGVAAGGLAVLAVIYVIECKRIGCGA